MPRTSGISIYAGVAAGAGGGPTPPYHADAVTFAGNSAFSRADLGGAADSPFFLLNTWLELDAGSYPRQTLFAELGDIVHVRLNNDKKISVYCQNTMGDLYLDWVSDDAMPDSVWQNLRVTVDTNHPAGEKIIQVYLGDTPVAGTADDPTDGFSMPFSSLSDIFVCNDHSGGNTWVYGDMADYWFGAGQFFDQTSEADRRHFIDAGGKPVDPADAIVAYGQPSILFSGDASTFGTNQGTAGAFTPVGDPITDATSSPSD